MNKPERLKEPYFYERLIADRAGDSITVTCNNGLIEWVNAGHTRLTGFSREDVIGHKPGDLLQGPETDPSTVRLVSDALKEKRSITQEILNYHKTGRSYWVEMSIVPVFDDTGRHTHFLSIERDITGRKDLETEKNDQLAIEKQKEEERTIIGQVSQWMYSAKSLDELLQVTRRAMSTLIPEAEGSLYIYSETRDTLEVASAWGENRSIDGLDPDQCWALRRGRAYSFGTRAIEFACAHVGTEEHPFFCLPIVADGETIGMLHLRFTCLDLRGIERTTLETFIDQRWHLAQLCAEQMSLAIANVRLRQVLLDRSVRDPLTNLWNRRWLLDTTKKMLAQARNADTQLSLLSLDVDHFKAFNDTYGHDAGDLVLREVADVLVDVARDRGAACRTGGEEFVLLCPGLDHDSALKLAADVRLALAHLQLRYEGQSLGSITVSIGVATHAQNQTVNALIREADAAMYRAKQRGRDRVVSARDHDSPG